MAHNTVAQSAVRRIVTLDIETVSLDPQDSRGALSAMAGRIVCIGLLFDDGEKLTNRVLCHIDEKVLLEQFWGALQDTDLLVGHNVLGFDLLFIRQRSWILGVKPSFNVNMKKYYTEQVVDVMEQWTNWGKFAGAGLDNIAAALGCGQKTGHGSEVGAMWANRQYRELMDYCMADVELTYRCYCRMQYREPLTYEVPSAIPVAVPAPEVREMVPVLAARAATPAPAQFPMPVHVPPAPPQPAAMAAAPAALPQPARPRKASGRRRAPAQINWMSLGGALVLSGATYQIRDDLKQLGARASKDSSAQWIWQVSPSAMPAIKDLCGRTGIQLVSAAA